MKALKKQTMAKGSPSTCGIDNNPYCKECRELKDLLDIKRDERFFAPCKNCHPEEYEVAIAPYLQKAKQNTINLLLGESQLAPRFINRSFEDFKIGKDSKKKKVLNACRQFAENFTQRAEKGTWLLLLGPCGTGKGHLAAAIINVVTRLFLVTTYYVKLHDVVRKIKQTWGGNGNEEDILKTLRNVDLLVIDEIGVQFKTESERLILYAILDHRYEHLRPTILTSNLSIKQLEKIVGERIIDRCLDQESENQVLLFEWESYRKEARKTTHG